MWVVMFTGLPASGKSYIRQKLIYYVTQTLAEITSRLGSPINEHDMAALDYCRNFRIVQVSSDDVIDMIAAHQGKGYSDVFDAYKKEADLAFWHRLRLAVACRSPLIIADRTFVNEKARRDVVTTVQQQCKVAGVSYRFMVIEVKTPHPSVWNERLANRPGKIIPKTVLDDMAARQTSPSDDEFKYDELISVINPSYAEDAVYLATRKIIDIP